MLLFSLVLIFAAAALAPWLLRFGAVRASTFLTFPPLVLTGYFLTLTDRVGAGAVVESHPWVPALGVNLTFYLDGLSLLFVLLVSGVGTLVFLYAGHYMREEPQLGRFFFFLTFFMGSMLGLVLAGNLITLFVFWELTSISSYFLIGYRHGEEESRAAALQALLVTGLGGLALLAGFLLLGQVAGSLEMSAVLGSGEVVRDHPLYLPILLLVLAGAFTKSAQFPFHFWLPSAMAAPTPVSAYLHSVTMVKAGIYLLARFSPVLGGTPPWQWSLILAGAATMLLGVVLAIGQNDLKRLLAYSTINSLGILVFLLGIDTEKAVHAALVFLLVHALYKGALFLVAGIVDHQTGTRDIRQLRGLGRQLPLITVATALAALSMAGFPPLFGFIGKETIYHVVLDAPSAAPLLTLLTVLANVLLVAVAALFVLKPFFGRPAMAVDPHPLPAAMTLGPVLLAAGGLVIGLLPWLIDERLLTPAASAVLATPTQVELALWHGINLNLLLSLLTFVLGAGAYLGWLRWGQMAARWRPLAGWGPATWYKWGLKGLTGTAAAQTRILQHGYLSLYLLAIFVATCGFAGLALWRAGGVPLALQLGDLQFFEAVIALLILASAVVAIRSDSRLGAIVAMGVIGYGIALIYIEFGAPDLAMTQFIIETITVILFILVISRLPAYAELSSRGSRLRDALVAVAGGGLMTVLVLAALATGSESRLADFFAETTYPEAHGRDIVNVILVDFRAMDTLGEITVLGLAGAGVAALLRLRPTSKRGENRHQSQEQEEMRQSLILATATRYLMPMLLLLSLFLFLRGHYLPGGGFIGGLVAAATFSLHAFAYGVKRTRQILRLRPRTYIGLGLLLALGSGLVSLVTGHPFLTGRWEALQFGAMGELQLGTPLAFDAGVFLVVIGATLAILLPLAEGD
ncbi:MAG: putative monovalent cation/H+ antiporter subunit A [Desulfuromonadales bacterium]|nr:putative monovalent cation/H+ antiporter subunit A [Desulfuromonadales bacterium]